MDSTLKQALENMNKLFGNEIFDNKSKFQAALLDVLGNMQVRIEAKKICYLLSIAIFDIGAYTRLKNAPNKTQISIISEIASEMQWTFELREGVSQIVIESIAYLHGFNFPPKTENTPNLSCPVQSQKAERNERKAKGNKIFQNDEIEESIQYFDEGIRICDEKEDDFMRRRHEAFKSYFSYKGVRDEVFVSYSKIDKKYANELVEVLRGLEETNGIITWHFNGGIPFGKNFNEVIGHHLKRAKVVIQLVSPSYMVSDYIKARSKNQLTRARKSDRIKT